VKYSCTLLYLITYQPQISEASTNPRNHLVSDHIHQILLSILLCKILDSVDLLESELLVFLLLYVGQEPRLKSSGTKKPLDTVALKNYVLEQHTSASFHTVV